MRAYAIRRESKELAMKRYGPREQWRDIEQNAPLLNVEVSEDSGTVIRESATKYTQEGREQPLLKKAIAEALELMREGKCQAIIFPRVDRATRFIPSSLPILIDAIHKGLRVFFARERFELDTLDSDSLNRYLNKAMESTAYVDTLRENSMRAKFLRAFEDGKLPNGRVPWCFDYNQDTGRAEINWDRANWVKRWRDWLLTDGIGILKLCRRMNEEFPSPRDGQWRPKTVTGILRSRALIGEFYARDEIGEQKLVYKDEGDTILTIDEFEAIGKRLDEIHENSYYNATKAEHRYPPITKFVYCSCGARMYSFPNRQRPYYRCKACGKLFNALRLWELFFPQTKATLSSDNYLIPRIKSQFGNKQLIANYQMDIDAKAKEIEDLEKAKDKAFRMGMCLQSYPIERVQEQIDKAEVKIQRLGAEQESHKQRLSNLKQEILDEEGTKRFCRIVSQNIDGLTKEQWEVLGKLTALRITVWNKTLVTVDMVLPPVRNAELEFDYTLPTSRKLT